MHWMVKLIKTCYNFSHLSVCAPLNRHNALLETAKNHTVSPWRSGGKLSVKSATIDKLRANEKRRPAPGFPRNGMGEKVKEGFGAKKKREILTKLMETVVVTKMPAVSANTIYPGLTIHRMTLSIDDKIALPKWRIKKNNSRFWLLLSCFDFHFLVFFNNNKLWVIYNLKLDITWVHRCQ